MGIRWWILIGLLVLISAVTRNSLLLLIGAFLGLLVAVSQLWGRYALVDVTYRRHFGTTRLFLGEETDLVIEVSNAKLLPLPWLRADDERAAALELLTPQPGEGTEPGRHRLVNVFSMRWYERVTRHYRLRGTQRGIWYFGPVTLRSTDIFGFELKRETRAYPDRLLVYPRLLPVGALNMPARHPFGDFKSQRQVTADPLRILGARPYRRSDNFRHIHWKASARRNELQSKTFEPSTTRPLALFLDVQTAEHPFAGQDWQLQEYAISAAASVARMAWEQGFAVALYANALLRESRRRLRVPARNHPDQLLGILEALAQIETLARWPVENVLEMEATSLRYGSTVVVLSAMRGTALRQGLMDLQQRGFGVTRVAFGDPAADETWSGIRTYHIGGVERWHELETLELA